jgi:pyrimidine-specific ribonucleoside hydrolase
MTVPLIIDTDPGVDDAVALLLAAASPEVELLGVTTVYGNVELERTTDNARRLLALAGRPDVPVARGAARPLVHQQPTRAADWHGADGLGGGAAALPEPTTALHPHGAVQLMAELLRASSTPVTIAAIGPMTNVALLLAVHPELAGRIDRLVVMGGSMTVGNTTGAAEFNVHCDPEAAQRVLHRPDVAVTMVPMDLTVRCAVPGSWLDALAAAGPRCTALAGLVGHYRARHTASYGFDGVALHDAVAVLEAAVPGTLSTTPLSLQVACDVGPARGATVVQLSPAGSGRAVAVARDTDIPALHATILERLGRLDA